MKRAENMAVSIAVGAARDCSPEPLRLPEYLASLTLHRGGARANAFPQQRFDPCHARVFVKDSIACRKIPALRRTISRPTPLITRAKTGGEPTNPQPSIPIFMA